MSEDVLNGVVGEVERVEKLVSTLPIFGDGESKNYWMNSTIYSDEDKRNLLAGDGNCF